MEHTNENTLNAITYRINMTQSCPVLCQLGTVAIATTPYPLELNGQRIAIGPARSELKFVYEITGVWNRLTGPAGTNIITATLYDIVVRAERTVNKK